MFALSAGLAYQDGDYLVITEYTQMDMKGYIPAKLMNMCLAGMAKA